MRSRVCYGFLLAATFLMCVVWGDAFLVSLLGFELMLLPAGVLLNHYAAGHMEILLDVPAIVEKKEEFPVTVQVKNHSRLPMSVSFVLSCTDVFDGSKKRKGMTAVADGRKETSVTVRLTASVGGNLVFSVTEVRIVDCLSLWKTPLKLSEISRKLLVMPAYDSVSVRMEELSAGLLKRGGTYSDSRSGDDVSSVFDTRDFRDGDTLQRVHWKLSAKLDELLVREFSMPVEKAVWLYVDLFCEEIRQFTRENWDEMLTALAALAGGMLLNHMSFAVVWYDERQERIFRCPVTDEESLGEVLGLFADAGVSSTVHTLEELIHEDEDTKNYEILRLDTKLHLYAVERQQMMPGGEAPGRELDWLRMDSKDC